ncbi:CD109 antigen-like [Tubulanus polymorphus]|uniref:CD109 antigen-like n=1 Tax=Tubulanus polymorphus TaxID=672921 RepID=UPI003DA30DF5
MKILACAAILISLAEITSSVRLWDDPTYFIVGPKRVHPSSEVKLLVSILKLEYPSITIRASIRNNREEYASASEVFDRTTTKLVEMRMPEKAGEGRYYMRIEGSIDGGASGVIFSNETELIFDDKRVSIFIQLNKLIYTQGQTVYFRVIPVQQNLMAAFGMVDIYAKDATGTVVRRWLSQQTNAGVISMSFDLSDQPAYGTWQIMLEAFGSTYTNDFKVIEYFRPRFDVNVTTPTYIRDNGIGLPVIITANLTSGYPVRGNATVYLTIVRRQGKSDFSAQPVEPKTIQRDVKFTSGRHEMFFTMDELRYVTGTDELENHEVWVNATVRDWFLLENQTSWAYSYIYGSEVHLTFLGGKVRTFKPGMIFTAYLAVARLDGAPMPAYSGQFVRIQRMAGGSGGGSSGMIEERINIPNDGIIRYTFIPTDREEMFTLRAYFAIDNEERAEQQAVKAYSPTNSYIQISTMTDAPKVNEYMIFQIQSSHYTKQIYYQIVSGGRIIIGDRLNMESKVKTFSVALSRDMSPMAHIVAYYIRPDAEVVVDALNFFVNGTSMYHVDLKINKGKDFSGHTVEIIGMTDPGVFISFSGIDRDQYIHGGNPFLTQWDIIDELSSFDSHANKSFAYTWRYSDELKHTVYFPSPTYGVDANTTFEYAGLFAFTDANVTGSHRGCNISQGLLPCLTYQKGSGTRCYPIIKKCDGVPVCGDSTDEMGCIYEDLNPKRRDPFENFNQLSRHHEDTSFMWDGFFTKPNGQVEFNAKVPLHIPFAWMVNAFAMSPEKGLGIMTEPRMFDHVQAFIMTMEMPTHAVKGEQLGVRVVLSNYADDYYEVLVTLHQSSQFNFVHVEWMGTVESYNPRQSNGDVQTLVYLESSKTVMLHFPIVPIVQGKVDVTITSATFMGGDTITRSIYIVYNGVTKHFHTPLMTDLLKTGSNIFPKMIIDVPQQFVLPEQIEHLYVPGSPVAKVSAVGDVVGPGFFVNHLDSENLMSLPYGCGEQAGFNFATNLYYMYFLQRVSALKREERAHALEYMNIALQRIMSYYNDTGYFSVFRDHQEPSVWLTAFILQTLHHARNPDWEYEVFIPLDLLNKVALWLIDQQVSDANNPDNGVFKEIGGIYDQKMTSNVTMENGKVKHTSFSLTAYVLIALSELKDLTGDARTSVTSAITRAGKYLGDNIDKMYSAYELSITAWALKRISHDKAGDIFNRLWNARKTVGEYQYWADDYISGLDIVNLDTLPHVQPKNHYPNEGIAVQATSYALMVLLNNNKRDRAYESMTWLQSMRNSIGGFASTQDSIVALQALAEYARQSDSRALYDIKLSVQASSDSSFEQFIDLDKKNFLTLQTVDIPVVWGNTRISAEGTGLVNVMLDVWVNVEYREFLRRPGDRESDTQYFSLDIPRIELSGKNFSIMHTQLCASWTNVSLAARSGMTVIEMDLPTGYMITNDVLRKYVQSNTVENLRRAEFYGKKVRFYFEYIDQQRTCVDFRADRWYPVANMTIQHSVRIYDYYEPGRFNNTMYITWDLFNLNICLSCGSFQCPYCPYYNAATAVRASLALLSTTIAIFITRFIYRT